MGLAVISSRERGIVDGPGEEEAHDDEKVGLVFFHAVVVGSVMFVCCYDELDHGVPGEVSKGQWFLEDISPD